MRSSISDGCRNPDQARKWIKVKQKCVSLEKQARNLCDCNITHMIEKLIHMDCKVIFQKTYPRIEAFPNEEDLIQVVEQDIETIPADQESATSAHNFLKKEMEERVSVMLPEHLEQQKHFIDTAIALSDYYQIDLIIMEKVDCITVKFSFDCSESVPRMKELFLLAEDITSTAGPNVLDIQIILEYYTHAIYRNGQRIR